MVEVHLQTEGLGWHTDDFLIVGETGSAQRHKLAGQVKRSFTVSATDDDCKKAFQDFWTDFKNPHRFSPAADRFALVTLRGSNTLLEYFAGLLDAARAAADGAEFERCLATNGFLNAKAVQYGQEIRSIIGAMEGGSVSAADIWPFLRVLHILSLDLNTSTQQTEASIKTLLAHTANGEDPIRAANESWNALLREVCGGMPTARGFRRNDLPEVVRTRHSTVGGADQRALRALGHHSSLILDGIRPTLGASLHLGRVCLVQQVIQQTEATQVVLVSGAAGSGKSSVAKDMARVLAADHFVFTFRAEEFATPHFDETLSRSQIPVSAATLGALLATQGRKVMLVESVERLLEASTRDAFTDLLTLVAKDPSWRIVLTCRDYSADLVRTAFLTGAGLGCAIVTIPPLDDAELQEVEAANPSLAYPLTSATLRRLLRNPYILDKALQVSWLAEHPLPQSEREFRRRVWQEIVRAEHFGVNGMPRRRENVFVQVALRRARALTLYASCADLDPEVIDTLRRDSLVVSSEGSGVLLAPAHDVLEDWAILQWIDEQHAMPDGSVRALSSTLGTYPAVRRTYRKWVAELVERDAEASDRLFRAVIQDLELPAQFRDDTIISLLRSSASVAFLQRQSADLLANDKRLLGLVIRLLRVACVTSPTWLVGPTAHPSLFAVPYGVAWGCVLRLVGGTLQSFTAADRGLLLGLVEDWAKGVSWQTPYPDGADSAAAIAHWLLPAFDDYRFKDQRKRTLTVLAKIPNADRARFSALLQGSPTEEKRDRAAEDFREIVFEDLDGMPAARDMPDAVVSVAKDFLLCSEVDPGHASGMGLETLFGINHARSHAFFPASAYRGPFLPLMRHHPEKALAFVIAVFNQSADWYAHPRVWSRSVEPPFEMALIFSDGTSKVQWCNGRLWCLYRGMSVGPYVLQSLLMATEQGLLELAEAYPGELDALLLSILKRSDSAALTAVVASIAPAFPRACGETLLVLLGSPLCIQLDRSRLANEIQAPSRMNGMFPSRDAKNRIYENERTAADARPHRRRDLQIAALDLQLGPLAPRVQQVLDRHRAALPPLEQQDEDDRTWRLALHRMDARQYKIAEQEPTSSPIVGADATDVEDAGYVRLDLALPEPDVRKMVDDADTRLRVMNARSGLLMWGCKVYGREEGSYDPGEWRQRLKDAVAASGPQPPDSEYDFGRGGPGFVAAVCVRDHWEEMTDDERDWCVNTVCSEVERGDLWNQFARAQRNSMSADRPCASTVPLLLGKGLTGPLKASSEHVLILALTHANDEVRTYAAAGIGWHLSGIDRALTLRCVRAVATEARLVQQAVDAETGRPAPRRRRPGSPSPVAAPDSEPGDGLGPFARVATDADDAKRGQGPRRQIEEIEAEVATLIRQRFFEEGAIPEDAVETLDPTAWFGAEANVRILSILGAIPTEPAAIAAFERLARTLVAWWDADDDDDSSSHRRERNFETEFAQSQLLQSFLLRTPLAAAKTILQPVLDAVDQHPKEVGGVLNGLILVEDASPNTAQFWSLWALFVEKVLVAKWLQRIDREHATGDEMLSAIFLGSWWKEEVRHWRSLEGYAGNVHALFDALPVSSAVLQKYLRLLYHVGEQSLPEAFIRIATRLQHGDPQQLLARGNSIYLLEVLLQRYVYGRPLELKSRKDLREAVLFILDHLVEVGSSAAFRMRDDFVTPISAA